MGSRKKPKLGDIDEIDGRSDIISSLPDCILTHVLSFLPTKDAVGTCILSSRWRDLWTGVPNIDLDDQLCYFGGMDCCLKYEYVPFMEFVGRIFVRHEAPKLNRFRLSCRVCFCPSRVSAWISSAVNRNLQELDLHLEVEAPFSLPPCVFYSQSLKSLKLNMDCPLILPRNVFLPNLKTLHLILIELFDDEAGEILFSSCPTLEELHLIDCDWRRLESIMLFIPTLKKLRIQDQFYWSSPYGLCDCIIKVHAPNLISFEYRDSHLNDIYMAKQWALTAASIFDRDRCNKKFEMAACALRLINVLQNREVLRLSADTVKSLPVVERVLGRLPVFPELKQIQVTGENENRFLEAQWEFLQSLPSVLDLHRHCGELLLFGVAF